MVLVLSTLSNDPCMKFHQHILNGFEVIGHCPFIYYFVIETVTYKLQMDIIKNA